VAGAALATVVSQSLGALVFVALLMRAEYRRTYATASGWRFEPLLLRRLLRYGLPSGLQYSLEILSFGIFMMIVGRLGTAPLAATGITFNLNMIVFMPMLGLGVAVSAVVGRYLGADRPDVAERATWSAFWLCFVYMSACGALYLAAPHALLFPYAAGADPRVFPAVEAISVVLLRFVAFYSLFDMMNVIFAAALRGAGDTFYPLALTVVLSWGAMLVPAWIACAVLGAGVYAAWCGATAYIGLLGVLVFLRFRAGRWRRLRVIEPHVPELDTAPAEA
jgi:MATE family multidrug resistance protein